MFPHPRRWVLLSGPGRIGFCHSVTARLCCPSALLMFAGRHNNVCYDKPLFLQLPAAKCISRPSPPQDTTSVCLFPLPTQDIHPRVTKRHSHPSPTSRHHNLHAPQTFPRCHLKNSSIVTPTAGQHQATTFGIPILAPEHTGEPALIVADLGLSSSHRGNTSRARYATSHATSEPLPEPRKPLGHILDTRYCSAESPRVPSRVSSTQP